VKFTKVLSTAMLFLLPGAIATVYAQEHEEKQPAPKQQQQAKPAQHQAQAKPAQKQEQAKPAQQPKQAARQPEAKPAARQQEAKPAAREQAAKPAARQQAAKPAAREQQAKPAQSQRAQGQQQVASRGQAAGGRGSIPEAKFRASFGSGHTFHVNRSEFANGSGRFQYGGFWFNVVDPWPVGWLYTDAVYVDFLNGGYFLCDPFHPGVYISINVG